MTVTESKEIYLFLRVEDVFFRVLLRWANAFEELVIQVVDFHGRQVELGAGADHVDLVHTAKWHTVELVWA